MSAAESRADVCPGQNRTRIRGAEVLLVAVDTTNEAVILNKKNRRVMKFIILSSRTRT